MPEGSYSDSHSFVNDLAVDIREIEKEMIFREKCGEYFDYLESIGFKVTGDLSLKECVELAEQVSEGTFKIAEYSDAVIHDVKTIMKEEITYLEKRNANLSRELEELKGINTDLSSEVDENEDDAN